MSVAFEQVDKPEVLFRIENGTGVITLDRPEALNSLHPRMMAALRQQLYAWAMDETVKFVLVHSNCAKSFCAGGDLRAVYDAGQRQDLAYLNKLFRIEYALNYLGHTYPKPYMALIDGIAMGGGMGLSVHGSHRILGDKALLAMPETNIGYFPDVGATYFLNQCPGELGLYLGLTGNHLKTADSLYAKWGTHYVPSPDHPALLEDLLSTKVQSAKEIDQTLASYAKPFPKSPIQENHQKEIDLYFGQKTVGQIFDALEKSSSAFAKDTYETLKKRSPSSLAVTFEQLHRGKFLTNFQDVMRLEFDLSQNFVQQNDFFEGIRAAIIDKDKTPNWQPKSHNEITAKEVDRYFVPHPQPLEIDKF